MRWKIFYGDGSTYSDQDGAATDAPGWDIAAIAEANETVGRQIHCKSDYYILREGRWIGVDFTGMLDHVVNELGIVKVGRMYDKEQWRSLYDQALNDSYLPVKGGHVQGEKRL